MRCLRVTILQYFWNIFCWLSPTYSRTRLTGGDLVLVLRDTTSSLQTRCDLWETLPCAPLQSTDPLWSPSRWCLRAGRSPSARPDRESPPPSSSRCRTQTGKSGTTHHVKKSQIQTIDLASAAAAANENDAIKKRFYIGTFQRAAALIQHCKTRPNEWGPMRSYLDLPIPTWIINKLFTTRVQDKWNPIKFAITVRRDVIACATRKNCKTADWPSPRRCCHLSAWMSWRACRGRRPWCGPSPCCRARAAEWRFPPPARRCLAPPTCGRTHLNAERVVPVSVMARNRVLPDIGSRRRLSTPIASSTRTARLISVHTTLKHDVKKTLFYFYYFKSSIYKNEYCENYFSL